jgi:DNA-binding MarR family transcriptional regulator
MGLSEEIQQKKFVSEKQKALLNIIYTYNSLISEMNAYFKTHDITRQQFNVLRILRGQYPKPCSINLIKDRMLDKMSDTSRIVKRLENKGLLNRMECDTDRRAVEISISKAGLDLLSDTDKKVSGFEHLLSNLSEAEAAKLNILLDKIRE